jgi:hypothetical protein
MRRDSFSYRGLLGCAGGLLFGGGGARLPAPPVLVFGGVAGVHEAGGLFGGGGVVAAWLFHPSVVVF